MLSVGRSVDKRQKFEVSSSRLLLFLIAGFMDDDEWPLGSFSLLLQKQRWLMSSSSDSSSWWNPQDPQTDLRLRLHIITLQVSSPDSWELHRHYWEQNNVVGFPCSRRLIAYTLQYVIIELLQIIYLIFAFSINPSTTRSFFIPLVNYIYINWQLWSVRNIDR
jgi:hypothetical protein